jgi:hypothetical protein
LLEPGAGARLSVLVIQPRAVLAPVIVILGKITGGNFFSRR